MSADGRAVLFEYHLSAPTQAFLEARGWVVSREVEHGKKIADFLAVSGDDIAAIELKLSLGLDVILQALNWIGQADFSWVGVPACAAKKGRAFELWKLGLNTCRTHGIGVIAIRKLSKLEQEAEARGEALRTPRVSIALEAVRQHHGKTGALHAALRPEHKHFSAAAGTKNGARWNATQARYRAVREAVQARGGVAQVADVALALGHLDSTVTAWAKAKKISCIQLDATGVQALLRVVDEGQEAPALDAREMKSRLPRYIPQ